MKKQICISSVALLVVILTACSMLIQSSPTPTPAAPPTQTPFIVKGIIHPGDKIGDMILEKNEDRHYSLYNSCNYDKELLAAVSIGPFWGAEASKFDASWEPMTWELYVDDYQIALDEFGYSDISYYDPMASFDVTFRNWNILLRNLTAGTHSIRFAFTLTSAVDDGWNTYPPGKYEYITNITVTEKPIYSALPPVPDYGQHAYASKNGDLDFLLYVPESYGVDPAKKWPLIVYLHDAEMRGSTDFLVIESLPKRLQTQKDFEFLVLSPTGDGDWDFWSKEEMIAPVIRVLDEIKAIYPVDPNRIYLTGAGMGGNGVWVMGMRNPEVFAALAPLGGYIYPFGIPDNICNLKDVPVWAFHGEEDFMVPPKVEQDLVNAVNTCGGAAKITVKPGAVVPIDVYYNSELFDWLLAQSKK